MGSGIVVEDSHRHETGLGIPQHVADHGRSGVATADHGHAQSGSSGAALPGEQPRVEAQGTHGHGPEDASDHHHAEGHHGHRARDPADQVEGDEGHQAGAR
jgi:hypothetical protein